MKININDTNNNHNKKTESNKLETKMKGNIEKIKEDFIDKIIINNTLHDFIKDESYTNCQNDAFKEEIFYFASFINSCKTYNNIKELKKDIKSFFRNKNEDIDYHYHILHNFLKQILSIISSPEFFKQKENIKCLIKIIKRFDKNLNSDSFCNIKYIDIKKNVINEYKSILDIFKKNNNSEHINIFIDQLTNNLKSIEYNLLGKKQSNISIKQKNNIIINNEFKEKENDNLNSKKILLKNKEGKKDNNIYETKIIFNKKEKKLHVINNKKNYNFENITFPPIQNSDDSFYK